MWAAGRAGCLHRSARHGCALCATWALPSLRVPRPCLPRARASRAPCLPRAMPPRARASLACSALKERSPLDDCGVIAKGGVGRLGRPLEADLWADDCRVIGKRSRIGWLAALRHHLVPRAAQRMTPESSGPGVWIGEEPVSATERGSAPRARIGRGAPWISRRGARPPIGSAGATSADRPGARDRPNTASVRRPGTRSRKPSAAVAHLAHMTPRRLRA